MHYAILLGFIFLTWCLWGAAALMEVAVRNRRDPLPGGGQRGVSFVPVIPLYPLVAWGAALLADHFADPWGTRIVGVLHVLFAVLLVGSIAKDFWRLKRLEVGDPSRSRERDVR